MKFLLIANAINQPLTVIISNGDKGTSARRKKKERARGDREERQRREPNPTISPRVALFQLTIGCFIRLQRVIAAFNHFPSLHGVFPLSVFPLLSSNPLLMASHFPPHPCSALPLFPHVPMDPRDRSAPYNETLMSAFRSCLPIN